MKHVLNTVLISFVLIAILVSCSENGSETTMRITISEAERTILPDNDYPLTITSYHIVGKGPNGKTIDLYTSRSSVSLEGIRIGEWELTATGLNDEGDAIAEGTTVFILSETSRSAEITLDSLVGEGTLSVKFCWNASYLSGTPGVSVTLTEQYGDKKEHTVDDDDINLNKNSGTATFDITLSSGSYTMFATLYSGKDEISKLVDAVRITDSQVSSAEIEFLFDDQNSNEASIEISDSTGIPVTLTIEGIGGTVFAGNEVTAYLNAANYDVSSFEITWYLDGELLDTGREVVFSPEVGSHNLTVIASTSKIGTTGSASFSFEVFNPSVNGAPYQTKIIDDSTLNLGEGTIIKFLSDGRALIASNENKTMQVISFNGIKVTVDKTINYSTIGISGKVAEMDTAPTDSSSVDKVFVVEENPIVLHLYNFEFSSGTLSTAYSSSADISIYASTLTDKTTADTVFWAGLQGERQFAMIGVDNSSEKMAQYVGYYYGDGGNPFSSPQNYYVGPKLVPYAGSIITALGVNGFEGVGPNTTYGGVYNWNSDKNAFRYGLSLSSQVKNNTNLPVGISWITETTLLVQSTTYDVVFDFKSSNFGENASETKSDGRMKAGLTTTSDYLYSYYIDLSTNELVSLSVSPDGLSLSELDRTAIETASPSNLEVSENGEYIILYSGSTFDRFELVRIARN